MKVSRLFLVRNGCIALVSLLSSVISLAAPHSQLTYIFDTIRKVEDSVVQANLLRERSQACRELEKLRHLLLGTHYGYNFHVPRTTRWLN